MAPNPCLRLDPRRLGLYQPGREFFRRKTVTVARDLVGTWIARRWRGRWYGARIVETEAYLGPGDAAAHSWKGRRTARVEPMYLDGGHLYVFFVYGMHCCANVVTRRPEDPQAVLLRAAEAPACPPKLLSGPGKLCAALGITVADSGSDLLGGGDIRVYRERRLRRPRLVVTPRIGVDYAGEAAAWPLRFFDTGSPAVSGRRIRSGVENRSRRPHNRGR
jgi:DNA-3-methyladenine glycosylase